MASITTENKVMLNDCEDWDRWLYKIQTDAELKDVWKYIDPDLPVQPDLPIEPEPPTFDDSGADQTLATLTSSEIEKHYQTLSEIWNFKFDQYHRWRHDMAEVRYDIMSSIHPHLWIPVLGHGKTTYEWLRALKRNFCPPDYLRWLWQQADEIRLEKRLKSRRKRRSARKRRQRARNHRRSSQVKDLRRKPVQPT